VKRLSKCRWEVELKIEGWDQSKQTKEGVPKRALRARSTVSTLVAFAMAQGVDLPTPPAVCHEKQRATLQKARRHVSVAEPLASIVSFCEIEVFETKCRTCPQNMVVAAGHNAYKDCYCPRGAYVADNRCGICSVEEKRNTAAVRTSDCVLCAFGYDPGNHSCKRCKIGFVKNKATSEFQKCPEYTFNNFPGEGRCFDCMSWTETRQSCEKNRTNLTSCPNVCK